MMKPRPRSSPMQAPAPQSAPDSIVRLVADYTGFDLTSSTVRERARCKISEHLSRSGIRSPEAYAEQLRSGGVELSALIDALSIRETYFFRERKTLERIRRQLLPELVRTKPPNQPVTVWSAGCASGEEAYSLAIIMHEAGLGERARIIATDVSQQALTLAQRARYRRWSLRDTDAETLRRYFYPDCSDYVLNYTIRRMVNIEHHNLAGGAAPAAFAADDKADLVLLRNVLIYFTPEVIEQVCKVVFDSLAEDGWLITGACDPALDHGGLFERIGDGVVGMYRRSRARVQNPRLRVPQSRSSAQAQLPAVSPTITLLPSRQGSPSLDPEPPTSLPARPTPSSHCDPVAVEKHSPLAEAEQALAAGDHARVIAIASWFSDDPHARVLCITALANTQGTAAALRECRRACADHPLSAELHFLQAVMSIDEGDNLEALQSLRRTLYLDSSLVIAHFSLAIILKNDGDYLGARRSLRNAANLCDRLDPQELLPLSGGQSAGAVTEEIEALLERFANNHEVGR